MGIGYTLVYAFGLATMLLLITLFGRSIIRKFQVFADEKGKFRRILGLILILV